MSSPDWLILNVDDQDAIRYAKTRALQRAGFRVMEAASGTEGLECVEKHRPALVLCDVQMPDINGFEVARTIKERWPGTLVMQVSASFVTAHDRARGLDYGADSYLTEPIEPEELVASVRALLRIKRYETDLQAANARREFIYALAERHRRIDASAQVLNSSTEGLARQLNAHRAGIYTLNEDGSLLVTSCWSDGVLAPIGVNIAQSQIGDDLISRYRAGETLVIDDMSELGSIYASREYAGIGVPMMTEGAWVGTLFVHGEKGRRWSADDVMLAEEVAGLTSDAMRRADANQQLRDLNESLEQRVAERTNDLRITEGQLRQSQKMEAVGQLTGGIAHDFNNLLTAIVGGIQVARRRIAAGRLHEADKFMDEANAAAVRAASLTHRLLAFSRRQSLDVRTVDIKTLVVGITDLLQQSVGESITLTTRFEDDLWVATTDTAQMETALLNLVINARDAMPDGGTIIIAARNFSIPPEAMADLEAGEYIRIAVIDTGEGMPKEILERIFDPFFTTKPVGQGTGLGLSMVYGFAKQSRGHVDVASEVGKGTEVAIFLPRATGEVTGQVPILATPDQTGGGGETILVAEDNAAVRMLVCEKFTELGYSVLEAANGTEAVDILKAHREIALLITDVGLPGVNGRQVAEIARQNRPAIGIIFITGYAEAALSRRGFLPAGAEMLTKPFDLDHLAIKVRQLLS